MTWIWILLFVGIVANGIRLRLRLQGLHVLEPSAEPPSAEHGFLTVEGLELDDATRSAASAHARRENLQVLDLIPPDLPVARAIYFLRVMVPKTYRTDPLAAGHGAGQAMLLDDDVRARARVEASLPMSPQALAPITKKAKSHAPTRSDVAIAPGLRATRGSETHELAFWMGFFSDGAPIVLGMHLAEYLLLAAGLFVAPLWGLLALAAFQLQPLLIFSGGKIQPPDLQSQAFVRIFQAVGTWVRLVSARSAPKDDPEDERRRTEYAELIAAGTDRFFEPRREDCPLCESTDLREHIRVGDRLQHKPGEFVLERCRSCGHVFQNPRLTIEGLNFYYKDFYDGIGEAMLDLVFASGESTYRSRAQALEGLAQPKRWLDVGAGHAHFCLVAKQVWPDTQFDGLDMSESIEEAGRRGWVTEAYRHAFPDIAPKLEGVYDVVSMHHYLEHTREPREELASAARVLQPGGHFIVEVPDPESIYGRMFGNRWVAWFQPQHLNLLSIGNLETELQKLGMTVVKKDLGAAQIPTDLSFVAYSLVENIAPPAGLPWQEKSSFAMARRIGVLVTLGPLLALALALDQVLAFFLKFGNHSNTYRVIARKG